MTKSSVDEGVRAIRSAVELTRAERTARLVEAWGEGPVPRDGDVRGVGVVDFAHDRLWIKQRNISPAFEAKGSDVLTSLVRAWGRRSRERYFEGGAEWKRRRFRGWRPSLGSLEVDQPKGLDHPLWLLECLARLTSSPRGQEADSVAGVETTRYSLELTEPDMPPSPQFEGLPPSEVWEELAAPDWPIGGQPRNRRQRRPGARIGREAIPAVVRLDSSQRIRRMGYERSRMVIDGGRGSSGAWSTIELSDFGLSLDRHRPPSVR